SHCVIRPMLMPSPRPGTGVFTGESGRFLVMEPSSLVDGMRDPGRITHSTEGRSGRADRTGPRPSTATRERVGREFPGPDSRLSPASEQVVFRSGRRVPQFDGPVVATGGQAPAVRTAGQPFDQSGVSAKVEHSPRGKVPDLHFTQPRGR